MIQVHFYWPDDYRGRFAWTRWRPMEWLWWLGYATIFSGEPCHCILQIDDLFFDWTIRRGLRVHRRLTADPSLSVRVVTGFSNESFQAAVAAIRMTIHRPRCRWRLIAGVFGLPMPMASLPQSCVTLLADCLDVRVDSLRPISVLRILLDHRVDDHGNAGTTHRREGQATLAVRSQDADQPTVPREVPCG